MLQADRYEYEHIERICPKVAACTCLYFASVFDPLTINYTMWPFCRIGIIKRRFTLFQIMNPGAHSRIVCSERMIKVTLANFAPLQSGVIKNNLSQCFSGLKLGYKSNGVILFLYFLLTPIIRVLVLEELEP